MAFLSVFRFNAARNLPNVETIFCRLLALYRLGRAWLVQAAEISVIETRMYLRDKAAVFWTFFYPVLLLLIMVSLFGPSGSRYSVVVDIEGQGPVAEDFIALLNSRFEAIGKGIYSYQVVAKEDKSPEGRIRVYIPTAERLGPDDKQGPPIVVVSSRRPDATTGPLLAIISDTITQLNSNLAGATPIFPAEFRLGDEVVPTSSSATYFVTGLSVLSMVSIALFGFCAPLIDLRARGVFKPFAYLPLFKSAFLTGYTLCRLIILMIYSLLFLAIGLLVFERNEVLVQANWLQIVGLIFLSSLCFFLGGLAIAGLVTSNTIATMVVNILNIPIIFLSDLFLPLETMPEFLQNVSQFNPVASLARSLREAVHGGVGFGTIANTFLSLSTLSVVSVFLIARTFKWRPSR